ncbi:TlpA family protein disulfide reductase [Sulfurimonas sp.]|uniref:TlpA family protein disulfide reductase n=1 Tax=Sulfurimonas sp. TaxID=2022749 RepID=UPI003D097C43
MLKKSFILLSVLAGLFFSACSNDENDANALLATNEFVLKELSGQEYVIQKANDGFVLKTKENQVIILDIFATWCPPCQAEASHLTKLQERYKDNLTIIGITVEDDLNNTKLQEFRSEYDAQYPLANSSENRRIIDAVANHLNIRRNFGIPLMAMYKDGKLVNYYQGATEEEFIESDIKKALGLQ